MRFGYFQPTDFYFLLSVFKKPGRSFPGFIVCETFRPISFPVISTSKALERM